jgi:alpha-glucosidase
LNSLLMAGIQCFWIFLQLQCRQRLRKTNMKRTTTIFIAFALSCLYSPAFSREIILKSPDGNISFTLSSTDSRLTYFISFKNRAIVANSPVLFSLDGNSITGNIKFNERLESYTANEKYPWLGVHSTAHNYFNGERIGVHCNKTAQDYVIDVRAFNDGVAFRLIIPGSDQASRIPGEGTVFNLPAQTTVWYHDLNMHYESVHVKNKVEEINEDTWLAPPVTFKLPQGGYASITEAALVKYPGMALRSNGKNGLVIQLANEQPTSYPYKLRYSPEDTLRLKQPAVIKGEIITPWRVIIIGEDLNALVNNDIVNNLNPPPDPSLFPKGINTNWIRPGRAVWKYLDGGGDGTVEVMKHFTDGAAALGFEHNILEGFWSRWTDEQIKDLVSYSKQKGVGIWFWKHSKSLRDPASRDSFFKRCSELGVTGAKIDFFDHEAKEVIDLYESILKEAAQYHLLLDFHGANKPTGLSRTYPNEFVREAVKGMESRSIADKALHETTIPFTRLLAGPAEYTVMHFGARRGNTTWSHQVASAAIMSAPLLTYAANPDTILANPAVNIIKDIPAVWDETIVLPVSEIGELAAFARRKGSTWFLAIMNGSKQNKIRIPLNFLNVGNYKTRISKDVPGNPAAEAIEEKIYSSRDMIELELTEGGGYIAEFLK